MSPIACVFLAFGAVGHVVLWVAIVNRSHAFGVQRRWVDLITAICGVMLVTIPIIIAAVIAGIVPVGSAAISSFISNVMWTYVTVCAAVLAVAILQRWHWCLHPERHGALLSNHTSIVRQDDSVSPFVAPGIPTWLGSLPGNEVLRICVHEKAIAIPRMSQSHEPLRIVHLTDLHMSGRITRPYFERVVEETIALQADIIAITGDIVEHEKCLDWIPTTLGRLQASGGVYYVLGNHDKHVNEERLKTALADAGFVHLGAECRHVTIRGASYILGGNELPWYKPASNFANCPPHDSTGQPLRILLAHSPDQFEWRRRTK